MLGRGWSTGMQLVHEMKEGEVRETLEEAATVGQGVRT